MRYLVVDTNVLISDVRLRSASLQTVLRASRELNFTIAIPAVVIDEAVGVFRRRYREQEQHYSRALRKLENSLGTELVRPVVPDIELAASNYRNYLYRLAQRYRVKILDYPSVSHREIVLRASNRKAPMSNSDKGYKDYLVWKTVVELAVAQAQKITFLTFNTKDFIEDGALKTDLKNDLMAAGAQESLEIFTSLKRLIEVEIEPHLVRHDEFKRHLTEGRIDWFIPIEVARADAESREGDELHGGDFEMYADPVYVMDVGEPQDVMIERIVRINDQFVKVDMTYTLTVEVEGKYVIDDPDPRVAAEGYQAGQGDVGYEIELILDLENEEIAYDYDLEADT